MPEKEIVFLTNTPVPYQLDMFGKLAEKTPVRMLLASANNAGQNVAWKLDLPTWAVPLPAIKAWQRWRVLNENLAAEEIFYLILGGYKLPYAVALRVWAFVHGLPVYYWMERPQPHTRLKAKLRNFVMGLFLRTGKGVWGIDSQAVALYSQYNKNTTQQPYAISGYGKPKVRAYKKPLKCLYIGQFIERKGLDIVFSAFEKLDAKDVTMTFAGKGPQEDEVNAFCTKYGHTNAGFVQPADLPKLLAEHDIFVFPSRYDGWGVVVAEALAAGLPVLTSDRVGAHDLLTDEMGAVLPLEGAAFAAAIQRYVDDTKLLKTHSTAAYKGWQASFANSDVAVETFLAKKKLEDSSEMA